MRLSLPALALVRLQQKLEHSPSTTKLHGHSKLYKVFTWGRLCFEAFIVEHKLDQGLVRGTHLTLYYGRSIMHMYINICTSYYLASNKHIPMCWEGVSIHYLPLTETQGRSMRYT